MTTDEIAAAVQVGELDVLALREAVLPFTCKRARRWAAALGGRGGMVEEDYQQTGFLALLDALETWEPEAGSFLTWYALRLRSAFTKAAGLRTARERRDPLQTCISLDAPITDGEGDPLHLEDIVPDPAAEAALNEVGERDYHRRLHNALCTALAGLPETQRAAVASYYVYGKKALAKDRSDGLRALRNPAVSGKLLEYL